MRAQSHGGTCAPRHASLHPMRVAATYARKQMYGPGTNLAYNAERLDEFKGILWKLSAFACPDYLAAADIEGRKQNLGIHRAVRALVLCLPLRGRHAVTASRGRVPIYLVA